MALLAEKPTTAPPDPPAPYRRSWRERINPRYVTLAVAAIAVAYLALVPVGTML